MAALAMMQVCQQSRKREPVTACNGINLWTNHQNLSQTAVDEQLEMLKTILHGSVVAILSLLRCLRVGTCRPSGGAFVELPYNPAPNSHISLTRQRHLQHAKMSVCRDRPLPGGGTSNPGSLRYPQGAAQVWPAGGGGGVLQLWRPQLCPPDRQPCLCPGLQPPGPRHLEHHQRPGSLLI